MKHIKYTTVVLCVLSLMLLAVPAIAASVEAPSKVKGNGQKVGPVTYKPGEVIVIWKDGAASALKARVKSSVGVERALTTAGGRAKTNRELLKLRPGVSTEAAVVNLRKSPAVKAAGFNRLMKLSYTPSSSDFPNQWGLNNTGQTIEGQPGTPDADIDAPEAWDIEGGNSNPTTVAVIDTGIDLDHPNLSGRLWTNSADPVNGVDDDGNGYTDDNHGYNWAGISDYSTSDAWAFGLDTDSQEVAQKFKAQGINGQCVIGGLEMAFYGKEGTPTATITYALRSTPGGADIVATNPIPASSVAASGFTLLQADFTAPCNLTPGNDYYFVASTSGVDTDNYFYIIDHVYSSVDPDDFDSYVEGSEWWNFSGDWYEYPNDDFYFKSTGYYYNRDNNGHGTHGCGIVGAADSGAGSVGVAPGDATRLMALKAGDSSGSLWSNDWMDAIDYASSMGADIISMSFGGIYPDAAEQTVITNACNNGLALFASSGNDWDTTINYPAAYDNVIGVGATDNRDAHADFSNYNSSVDVSAPGVDYYSTMPAYPVSLNWWYAQSYDYLSGTSMACPCAAGTAALAHSQNPAYTPAQIQNLLQSTADDLGDTGRDDYFGWGRVNAWRAVGGSTVPTVTSVDPAYGPPGTSVTITGSNFGDSRGAGKGREKNAASYVTFNGVAATEYTKWTNTEIVCVVPQGATPGPVVVVTGAGSSNADKIFTVASPTWYLAEGTTDWGFSQYISIMNPNPEDVTAHVTYMTKSGPKEKADFTLPASSQTTINPKDDIGATDFSTAVTCKEGKTIAVDRTMTWTGPGAASPEAHNSVGVTSPEKIWYLAEGSSSWGFECWLLIQNPNPTEATATVTYMIEGSGPVTKEKKVPASSRATFNMKDDIGEKDASIKVEADVPVIPERAMYRNNRREGHDSIGTTAPATDYFLAEGTTDYGFTTYVLVQNPNDTAASVTVTYMTGSGPQPQAPFSMPANSRKTIRVNDVLPNKDLSTQVHSDQPIIAERAMYWGEGKPLGEACHDSIGMAAPHTTFYLPDGQAGSGYEAWTLVQNPNDTDVSVEISYLTQDGKGDVVKTETIPASSRRTFGMYEHAGIIGRAAIMVTSKTAGKKIMVERAMYWNSRGAGTDTIGGYSD